jgi:AraC-like DNA-binding protein
MHLSERTLRRRLSEYDTSYLDLLDELRAALARKLLQRPDRSIDGIAEQLGFSDPSSFFHAFKRWTGSTPVQFRRQLRSEI